MLSEVAEQILKTKYYKEEETFDQLCLRVAYTVAQAEKDEETISYWAARYYQLMNELWFLPAGRILANADSKTRNLYNCYTVSIEDSRESIYRTLANTAEIFAHGGGVGINFSKLRERGTPVSNGSAASGPISFMHVFDKSADVISQASRRGAMLGLLEVDHIDIEEFIKAKDEEGVLIHFNLSVGLTDEFMQAVGDDEDYYLKSRYSGVEVPVDARTLFDSIAQHAWKSGDPGFIYIDRLEEDNATPHTGKLEVTNPCGETPLRDEACCLASINLTKMLTKVNGKYIIDQEKLVYTVSLVTRFLDSVHDVSQAPIPEIDEKIMGARRIGIGVFGWADILAILGIPYESPVALALTVRISAIMKQAAYDTSILLAEEKGAYPVFDPEKSRNIWYPSEPVLPTRNAMLLSLAPTGCYDEETEVLTKDGWKYFRDVNYIDEVFTFDKNTRTWKYDNPTDIISYDYDGELIKLQHKSFDLLVTPNHRMLVRNSSGNDKLMVRQAGELNYPTVIPQVGTWVGISPQSFTLPRLETSWKTGKPLNLRKKVWEEKEIPMEIWLRFLGYYLSEGSFESKRVCITQRPGAKREKILNTISELPFSFHENTNHIRIGSKQLSKYVEQFGKAKNKFVPAFIKELSPDLIDIFLNAYVLGDGHVTNGIRIIWTASKQMADDLQELFFKIGKRATIHRRDRTQNVFGRGKLVSTTIYVVTEIVRKTSWIKKKDMSTEYYSGKVYCVSVPNSFMLVRRNGLATICGNSISLLAGMNGGIEPFFALAYRKNVTAGSGETKYQIANINQYLLAYLDRLVDADTKEKVLNHLALTGEIQSLDYLPIKLRDLFKTAHDISPEFRVEIQAAWQKNVDGAISSTINLPNSATVEDIKEIIMLGWKLKLKGLTVFRDKCRSTQILEVGIKSNCNCETCGI